MEMQSEFLSSEMRLQFERGKTTRHNNAKPPKEAYFYIPRENELIEFDENNPTKILRKIFEGGVEYNYYELIKLKELKRDIEKYNLINEKKKKSKLNMPIDWKECNSLRFLQATGFNVSKTIEILVEHIEWRKVSLPGRINDKGMEILNLGFIYIHGRDSRFRPIINIIANVYEEYKREYSNADWERAVIYFLEYTINNLLIPGQVENWNVICDLKDISITSLSGDMKRILLMLQNNYRCRLFVMYIINIGGWVSFGWSIIKKLVTPCTERKIKLLKPTNVNELFFFVNPSQVEKKFGGFAEDIVNFYFPPIFPYSHYLLPSEKKHSVLLDEEVYKALVKNNKQMVVSPFLLEDEIFNSNKNDDLDDSALKQLLLNNVSFMSTQNLFPTNDFSLSNRIGLVEINFNNHSKFHPMGNPTNEFFDFSQSIDLERSNQFSAHRLAKNTINKQNDKVLDMNKLNKAINKCPLILNNGFINPSKNRRKVRPINSVNFSESTYASKIGIEKLSDPNPMTISKSTNEEEKPLSPVAKIITIETDSQKVCCSGERQGKCLIM